MCQGAFFSHFPWLILLIPNPWLSSCSFQLKHCCLLKDLEDCSQGGRSAPPDCSPIPKGLWSNPQGLLPRERSAQCLLCSLSSHQILFPALENIFQEGDRICVCLPPPSDHELPADRVQWPLSAATAAPAPRTELAHSRCSGNTGGLGSSELCRKTHAEGLRSTVGAQ